MITAEDMAGLMDMAEGFMQTSVDIYHATDATTGWDDSVKNAPALAPDLTVLGWVRSRPNVDLDEDLAALINEEQTRLFVPVGTVLEKGDRVVIAGDAYNVIDTNAQNTWRVLLRCSLRRIE